MSVGWVLGIALMLWGMNVRGWEDWAGRNFFWCCFLAITAVSGALSCVPIGHYGSAGAWCWINNSDSSGDWLRYFCFYGPLWVVVIVMCALYYSLVLHLLSVLSLSSDGCCTGPADVTAALFCPQGHDDIHQSLLLRKIRKLCLFPVVLVACWLLPTVYRVRDSVSSTPSLWLSAAALASSNLTGLFNALVYGIGMKRDIADSCAGMLGEDECKVQPGSPTQQCTPHIQANPAADPQVGESTAEAAPCAAIVL
eukprot:TRINITY_DN11235_c0_g1_i2.p1 TRINITY_DN11235_c0_g1~~TRINITY_DN11235_c0_g1_i2.p1  ORF type:complete len:253 (-),score=46.24 TRINITY_DN11235_c0_g1_i2:167-925(-)